MTTPAEAWKKVRPPSATEQLDDMITELGAQMKLGGWNEFVEAVDMPADLAAGLLTGRTEILRAATPRAMTEAECATLYKLIIVLIETNMALRTHAEQLAHQVNLWAQSFKQLDTVGRRIEAFANFKRTDDRPDEE